MEIASSLIETGVDKLVNLVKERGRIALADAAKELGVSATVIQEWVDFLEEEGIISVEYKMKKPYLVERKLSKKEVEVKAKEFAGKKDVFVRKAEVSLNFLAKQADELKKAKSEFDRLKQELQKQVEEQKNDAKLKIGELTQQVQKEQKKYQELSANIGREKEELSKEKAEAMAIKNSELHIEKLNMMIEDIRQRVEEEKSIIDPLIERSKEQEKKVLELQDKIIKKIAQKQKSVSNVKNVTKKVEEFFNKKLAVMNLVDKANKDRDELEKSLIELIKKAKSFQLTAKSGDVGKQMIELE